MTTDDVASLPRMNAEEASCRASIDPTPTVGLWHRRTLNPASDSTAEFV